MRLALLLLSVLIVGCGSRTAATLPDCPAPAKPELMALVPGEPLDGIDNLRILMERDDCMRLYIRGLEDTLECYKRNGG